MSVRNSRVFWAVTVVASMMMMMMMSSSVLATPVGVSWYNFSFAASGDISDNLGTSIVFGDGLTGGGFLQLIWAGADGLIDGPVNYLTNTDGTSGDDVVRATWYVDGGTVATDGAFFSANSYATDTDNGVIGNILYVRAWSEVSDAYTGSITDEIAQVDQWAGESSTYTMTADADQFFDLSGGASDWSTSTFVPVPEPGTLSLLLLGLGVLGVRRKRKK